MTKLNDSAEFDKLLSKLNQFETTAKRTEEMRNSITDTNLTYEEKSAIARNNIYIEDMLQTKKGGPMTISEADEQNTNPKYFDGVEYQQNCQVCTGAYMLRRRGFDIIAGEYDDSLWESDTWYRKWNNADGTEAKPVTYAEWLMKNGFAQLTEKRWLKFIEDNCQENGVYEISMLWDKNKTQTVGGHVAIIEKTDKGLIYVDPQLNQNETLEMIAKCIRMNMGERNGLGIIRIDNKVFKTAYVDRIIPSKNVR